jgi:hypothetical protein
VATQAAPAVDGSGAKRAGKKDTTSARSPISRIVQGQAQSWPCLTASSRCGR